MSSKRNDNPLLAQVSSVVPQEVLSADAMYLASVEHAYVYAYYIRNEKRKLAFKLVPSCQLDNGNPQQGRINFFFFRCSRNAIGCVTIL